MKGLRMNADSNETEPDRRALAISVWENEGGVRAPGTPDGQFGRRVEMDRSWRHCHIEQVEAAPPARSEELAYWNHTLRPSPAGE